MVMLKIGTILISCFLILPIISLASVEPNNYKEENQNIITVKIQFPEPHVEALKENATNQIHFQINDIPSEQLNQEYRIPVKPLQILIPYGQKMSSITITTTEMKLPVSNEIQGYQSHDDPQLFKYNGVHIKKGFQIVSLSLYPVHYNTTNQLFYYSPDMTVHVQTEEASPVVSYRGLDKDIKSIYSLVENPEMISSYPSSQEMKSTNQISYIIITNESFAQSPLEDNFDYLAYIKNQHGLSTEIFTVEEITQNPEYSLNGTWGDNNPSNPFYDGGIQNNYSRFDDTSARIRNFIRYAYMELGTEYVLLGGDGDSEDEKENIIPVRGLFANESGLPLINKSLSTGEEEADIPSDIYYACLDGTYNDDMDEHFGECADRNQHNGIDEADLYSEVSVGRACVDSYEEIAHFVSKTIGYQTKADEPYLSKMLFLGEYLGFPGISAYGGNYKDLVQPYIPQSYNVDTLYDRDLAGEWHKQDLISILNQATPHIINHDGHSYYGYNMRMYNSDVDILDNSNPFFVYSHGCMAGGFDNPSGYDCIAERLTVETPHGAFAAIMNARYGLGSENTLDSPSLALDISFFKALYNESIRELGPANHYSKEDHVYHIDDNGIRWVYYETNLFGDPSLAIHDAPEEQIDLSVDILSPQSKGSFYLFNNLLFRIPFLTMPMIIGDITVQVDATSDPIGHVYGVEFLLDDVSTFFDEDAPFEWQLDESFKGTHKLTVIVHSSYADTCSESLKFIGFNR